MPTYISMLRGINVGGQKRIRMDALKAVYGALGFKQVSSYIQSGNVIFKSPNKDRQKLTVSIEEAINVQFGYSVAVLNREKGAFDKLVHDNPFPGKAGIELDKLHVTFLSSRPNKMQLRKMAVFVNGTDEFQIAGENVYLYCPGGYARTKLSNGFLKRGWACLPAPVTGKPCINYMNWRKIRENGPCPLPGMRQSCLCSAKI